MKNLKNNIAIKIKEARVPLFILSCMLILVGGINNPASAQVSVGLNINLPFWAPAYDNVDQVGYYYLPDIEVFYDVRRAEFAYLEDGQWMFSPQLPPSYGAFDFNSAYVVVLNSSVYEPWMHYHYYVAHYPRYYYRTTYHGLARPLRGFNENSRAVVYRDAVVNHPIAARRDYISKEKVQPSRPARPMQYYGKTVGSPVKVEKQMRAPRTAQPAHVEERRK